MRSTSGSARQGKERTFIESARRAQIVAAAIDVIAERGYAQASLARIAERAGTSKGLLSYHFSGREDLVKALVGDVLAKAEDYMRPRITAESTGANMLHAYITSNLAFMGEYRNHLVAIVEIAHNARHSDGSRLLDATPIRAGAAALAQLLTRFQQTGEFRADFDPTVMAGAIRAAIDAVPLRLARDPDFDVEHYGQELASLFDHATRTSESSAGS